MFTLRRCLPILALLTLVKLVCPYRLNLVLGGSMEPSLRSGELCLVDMSAYHRSPPRRGDIVLARLDQETCVKRVYALPGDTFWVMRLSRGADASPLILGAEPERTDWSYAKLHPNQVRLEKITVPPGCLYLVGDNQAASLDSRELGWGYQEDVLGKVLARQARSPKGQWAPPPPPAMSLGSAAG